MDVKQLKEDVLGGLIPVDRLIDVVVTSQRELQAAKQELETMKAGSQQAPLSPLSVTLTVTPN